MKNLLFTIITICFFGNAFSQENYLTGARASGMANAFVAIPDIWSAQHNQAGLAFLSQPEISFHHENRFIIAEYGLQSFAAALPINRGTLGFNIHYFGYSLYNESKIGIAYAVKLNKMFSVGVRLNYLNIHIADEYNQNSGTAVVEAGIMGEPFEGLFIGIHAYNPNQAKFKEPYENKIPTTFRSGVSYKFYNKSILAVEVEKDLDYSPIYKAGLEFFILNNLVFRTGISTNPRQNSFGLGYIFRKFTADIAFTTHPQLSITPHFSLSYKF